MTNRLKYQMVIQWSEEDDCFLVGFPDFPGQQWRTHGKTYLVRTDSRSSLKIILYYSKIIRIKTNVNWQALSRIFNEVGDQVFENKTALPILED